MIELSIEQNGNSTNAVYLLQSGDRIDNLTLGMLVNNKITGVAPISPIQIKDDKFFQYNITNSISMRKYLGESVQREKLLRVFLQIAETVLEAGEYMINPTSFMLDEQNIFIEKDTGNISIVCIPLLTVVNDGNTCNFFKSVMFSSQFDLEENGDYIGKLITFLNPKTFTLEKFIEELQSMLGIEVKEEQEDKELSNKTDGKESDAKDADVEEESEESESLNKDETKEESESSNKDEAEASESSDKDETEASKSPNKDEAEKTESSDKEETEEVEETENIEETDAPEEIDSVESVQSEDEVKDIPFLVRSKTSQKIYIKKDEFIIGSDKKNVDYCIKNNPNISKCHAKIVRHENEYFAIGNDSENHIYLNGVLVESGEENFIPHGAMLRLANEDYEFKMHE